MSTWMITGTSGGLGRALAEQVLAAGHQLVATSRDPSSTDDLVSAYPQTAAAVSLDVTEEASRRAAVRAAQERFGGVDVLVNNAGYAWTAAVEEREPEAVDALFATNVLGPAALVQAVLPGMRERGSGTVVTISSVGVRATLPGGGWYSATKAALEALSGSLRREVEGFGIQVVVVQPGSMRTDFRGGSARSAESTLDVYDEVLGRRGGPGLPPQKGDPAKAAAALLQAVQAPSPPHLLLLGSDALELFRTTTDAEARDVEHWQHLAPTTDA